jgi:hypothetical protein
MEYYFFWKNQGVTAGSRTADIEHALVHDSGMGL